jgi:hypothetical protein
MRDLTINQIHTFWRAANLDNIETTPGLDRDEFPPAIFEESASADLKHILAGGN